MNKNNNETNSPREQLVRSIKADMALKAMLSSDPNPDIATYEELRGMEVDEQLRILIDEHPELFSGSIDPVTITANEIIAARGLKPQKTEDYALPDSLHEGGYSQESIYFRLTPEDREAIDNYYLMLMQPDVLARFGRTVTTPQEASDALGLSIDDVERSFGMLESIVVDLQEGDEVEYIAIDFSKTLDIDNPRSTTEGRPGAEKGENSEEKYIARVRYDSDNVICSVVLDAVPPVYGNAVYVVRGDDGRLDNSGIPESKSIASSLGARRIFHREQTGEEGTLKRIGNALTMAFKNFLDRENYPRL